MAVLKQAGVGSLAQGAPIVCGSRNPNYGTQEIGFIVASPCTKPSCELARTRASTRGARPSVHDFMAQTGRPGVGSDSRHHPSYRIVLQYVQVSEVPKIEHSSRQRDNLPRWKSLCCTRAVNDGWLRPYFNVAEVDGWPTV